MVQNAGWDFSIGRSSGTGTVHAVRPPPVADRKRDTELLKVADGSTGKEIEHYVEDDDMSMSGTGTFVVRSPRGGQSSSPFSAKSNSSSSTYASLDDTPISGTIVYRGQQGDSDSPLTLKSRLGIHERSSSASLEDSSTNLAEARAAIQTGARKGNPRERYMMARGIRDDPEAAGRHQSRNSTYLSVLVYPSLKEAMVDDQEGSALQEVLNYFTDMERLKLGSSEMFITRLLQRLASSRDSSLKDVQEGATRIFSNGRMGAKSAPAEVHRKERQNKELHTNANLSPLARFFLTRWNGHASRDLSS